MVPQQLDSTEAWRRWVTFVRRRADNSISVNTWEVRGKRELSLNLLLLICDRKGAAVAKSQPPFNNLPHNLPECLLIPDPNGHKVLPVFD
jgi:hypothetical protein